MTKSQELAVIDAAIKQLGTDSYLGPWLQSIRPELESTIRSDFMPEINLKFVVAECNRRIETAKSEAEFIISQAKIKAKAVEAAADKHFQSVANAIRNAQHELNRF
jgi:hypothetical protein